MTKETEVQINYDISLNHVLKKEESRIKAQKYLVPKVTAYTPVVQQKVTVLYC